MIGYIPDMIFDAELDYLGELGIERVPLASNSVPVQLKLAVHGVGLCVAHDFALPSHKNLRKVLVDEISLTRSFYLVRHQGDQRRLPHISRLAAHIRSGDDEHVPALVKFDGVGNESVRACR